MVRSCIPAISLLAVFGVCSAAEKAVQLKDLPAPVRKAVAEQTKGAQIKGFAKETENGQTFYEAETVVNGLTRDLLFDPAGALVEVEEETPLDRLPSAARAAIEKQASGGKIRKLETVTKGGVVAYEAAIVKAGKTKEVKVSADGSPAK